MCIHSQASRTGEETPFGNTQNCPRRLAVSYSVAATPRNDSGAAVTLTQQFLLEISLDLGRAVRTSGSLLRNLFCAVWA